MSLPRFSEEETEARRGEGAPAKITACQSGLELDPRSSKQRGPCYLPRGAASFFMLRLGEGT